MVLLEDMESSIDAFAPVESQNPQGSDVVFPVGHVTSNLTMPSVSPSQYVCIQDTRCTCFFLADSK